MTGLLDAPPSPPVHRRSARPLVVAGAAAVVVAALFWMVWFSPVLGMRQVDVRGAHSVAAARVTQAAAIPRGAPLAKLDTVAVARRVEAIPEVASARVSVSYPGTVVITVVERAAVGYVTQGSGAVLVDGSGTRFRSVAQPPPGLPRFDLPGGATGLPAGAAAATVASALPSGLRAKVAVVRASDAEHVTLQLADGRVVVWGGADRSTDKAQVLPALLGRPGHTYDVSNADLLVIR